MTRRDLLRNSALGFGSLALTSLLHAENPLAPKQPHFRPRARRVIFIFLNGGPAHMDTFEHKPRLQRDHGKPLPFAKPKITFSQTGNLLASPWEFKAHGQCGHRVSALFPNVARHVDDICFLHGAHGTNAAHGAAMMMLHTGAQNLIRPSLGAWLSYGLGTENANLPSYVTICPTLASGGINNWGSAFMPAHFGGTALGNASVSSKQARVRHIKNTKWTPGQQRAQLNLLNELNRDHLSATPSPVLESRINSFELAFRMQSAMPEAQDLRGESAATRRLYGMDAKVTENFGRQCLMARRFIERGVRFVQVTHSDLKVQWDSHSNLRRDHTEKAAESDRPIAGLLTDLKSRGLLDDTLVFCSGEFGRTPTVQGGKMDGRDHNPWGFTIWMAGGGVKGGFKYGATDDYGFYAERGRLNMPDLHATILHLLGLDHEKLTYHHAGRDFRLTDVSGTVVRGILA